MPKVIVECPICGVKFSRYPSQMNKPGKNYCSIGCRAVAIIGEGNPMYGSKKDDEYKKHMSDAMKGSDNPNWRGGKSATHLRRRKNEKDDRDDIWARNVKMEYFHKCAICSSMENVEAHHIKLFENYPCDRYDVSNGVALCRGHHAEVHAILGTMKKNGNRTLDYCAILDYLDSYDGYPSVHEIHNDTGIDISYVNDVLKVLDMIGAKDYV